MDVGGGTSQGFVLCSGEPWDRLRDRWDLDAGVYSLSVVAIDLAGNEAGPVSAILSATCPSSGNLDGGFEFEDAGSIDSGLPPREGGQPDAGSALDAGFTEDGGVREDAGSADSGAPDRVAPPDDEGPGCGCNNASPVDGLLAFVVALASLPTLRRQARRR